MTATPQKPKALVGSVPRLHYDVVQLVAQEIVDYMLVAIIDFEEIGQHPDGSHATSHRT